MKSAQQVLFASRIPTELKERLSRYCAAHGVKINFFVSRAIQERLDREAEDRADAAVTRARRSAATYIGEDQMAAYLRRRFSKR